MTFNRKCIGLAMLWLLYGVMVWAVSVRCEPRTALWVFGVFSSLCFFALLSVLFFAKGKP